MFSLIYSTRHTDCGTLVRLSDYRFKTRDDVKLNKDFEPPKLHCPKCWLEIDAAHFELWESVGLGVKKTIDETPIDQLNDVCKKLTNS